MIRQYMDGQLEDRIDRLHADVKAWAEQNDLWHEAIFRRVVRSFDMRTGATHGHDAMREWASRRVGDLSRDWRCPRYSGCSTSFDECGRLIENRGFYGEPFDEARLNIFPLEQKDPLVFGQFREYMRWKWICGLIQGDFDALNAELYGYFEKNSGQLVRLHWREYEMLIAELLQAQGFLVELGPGSADGGVDIRLIQRDPIGDILTLVQVKKHSRNRRIELQAVQALHGAKEAERADGSMFVTTSDYQPCARRFAGRENVRMDLYVSDDVRRWCDEATAGVIEDKIRITTEREVTRALNLARTNPRTIVHSVYGRNMQHNIFSLVLKESAGSGLVVDLPHRIVQHDGHKQAGTEIPDLRDDRKVLQRMNSVRRLKKLRSDAYFRFSDVESGI